MKGLLFFGFLLIVLLVASYGLQKEGFVNPGSNESLKAPQVIIPKVNPKPAPLEVSTPAPYLPPIEKTYGPALGDIAKVNTLPYKDPTLEAAPYARIAELLESLKGFFAFESKGLENQSDPEVQLPLTTARADLQRLTDEVSVLKRNPGIDSALTQGQVDDIQANLAYLQRKYRLSVNAASGRTGLIEPFINEGFSNLQEVVPRFTVQQVKDLEQRIDTEIARLSAIPPNVDPLVPSRLTNLREFKTRLQTLVTDVPVPKREGFQNPSSSPRLSLEDVEGLVTRVNAEMARLSASGTTDPLTSSRVNTLRDIRNNLQTIITEVKNGTKPAESIPILKSDMDKFLPVMGRPTEPLPQLIDEMNLPPSLSNLFPATGGGDVSASKIADTLFKNYGNAILKAITDNLSPPASNKDQKVYLTAGSQAPGSDFVAFPRGEMESATASLELDRLEQQGQAMRGPAKMDWKKKSAEICEQIRRRGLNPKDFGCIDPSKVVSSDYSWRGNARMVCTRLLTTPDPGLPETCGCPPLNWPGWRS